MNTVTLAEAKPRLSELIDRVESTREGDPVILRPRQDGRWGWASLSAVMDRGFSADFMANGNATDEAARLPGAVSDS